MSKASIAETFSIIYVDGLDNSCDVTVEHVDIMNAVALIVEKLACYRNCLISIALPKHPAFVSSLLGLVFILIKSAYWAYFLSPNMNIIHIINF